MDRRRSNESILNELGPTRKRLVLIQQRKLKYVGHAIRNERTDLMSTVLQGKVEGKRNRGRPSASLATNITNISGKKLQEVVRLSQDRESAGATNITNISGKKLQEVVRLSQDRECAGATNITNISGKKLQEVVRLSQDRECAGATNITNISGKKLQRWSDLAKIERVLEATCEAPRDKMRWDSCDELRFVLSVFCCFFFCFHKL